MLRTGTGGCAAKVFAAQQARLFGRDRHEHQRALRARLRRRKHTAELDQGGDARGIVRGAVEDRVLAGFWIRSLAKVIPVRGVHEIFVGALTAA